jgi:hypothetical protein
MLRDALRRFKDQWDNMVSIPCPQGDHIARRLPFQAVEDRLEITGVICQKCEHRFDWTVPSKSN